MMIDDLNCQPLKSAAGMKDLVCLVYRIQHDLVDIPIDRFLQVSDSRTRGPTKFFQKTISDATYSNSFFQRTVREQVSSGDSVCSIPGEIQITPLGVICSKTTTAHQ